MNLVQIKSFMPCSHISALAKEANELHAVLPYQSSVDGDGQVAI